MVLHKLQLSDGNYWDWHKMSVLMDRCNSYRDQLDFPEVPYLLIVLLYNISSIISFLLILYIVVTRKQENIF